MKNYTCKQCGFTTIDLDELMAHLDTHDTEGPKQGNPTAPYTGEDRYIRADMEGQEVFEEQEKSQVVSEGVEQGTELIGITQYLIQNSDDFLNMGEKGFYIETENIIELLEEWLKDTPPEVNAVEKIYCDECKDNLTEKNDPYPAFKCGRKVTPITGVVCGDKRHFCEKESTEVPEGRVKELETCPKCGGTMSLRISKLQEPPDDKFYECWSCEYQCYPHDLGESPTADSDAGTDTAGIDLTGKLDPHVPCADDGVVLAIEEDLDMGEVGPTLICNDCGDEVLFPGGLDFTPTDQMFKGFHFQLELFCKKCNALSLTYLSKGYPKGDGARVAGDQQDRSSRSLPEPPECSGDHSEQQEEDDA